MNKRKALGDRSIRQKAPSRRQSISSLQGKTQQRQLKTEKSPSTQNISNLEAKTSLKAEQISKAVDICIPKTRFNPEDKCRDKSYSSPRLKYFPAEEIKKLNNSPLFTMAALINQQNARDPGILYVPGNPDHCQNNGQGDVPPVSSLHQHQNAHCASQQQVAAHQTIHQVGQPNPTSECTPSQQVSASQNQRPFHSYNPDQSPQKAATVARNALTVVQGRPQTVATPQLYSPQGQNNPGSGLSEGNTKNEEQSTECPDYEKQPVGGRNAMLFRKSATSKQQTPPFSDPNLANHSNSNPQQMLVQNHYSAHGYMQHPQLPQQLYRQHPQELYRQMQQNALQQQQMQQRAMNYQMQMMNNQGKMQGSQYYNHNGQEFRGNFSGQGMTSPQDARNSRVAASLQNPATHQRELDYTMNAQNAWPKNHVAEYSNVKAQLKPFSVDVVNNNGEPQFRMENQQLYRPQQYQQQPVPQQLYRNPVQGNMTVQSMQNLSYTQPGFNQQVNFSQPSVTQSNPQVSVTPQTSQGGRKKAVQFTAGMVRDQEKLVSTMKQQCVPADVMKRQFETLLNEQRRQLEYVEQMQKMEEPSETRRPISTNRRKKQTDEKPEWMIHLTPSRLSYMELEKLHEQRKKESQAEQQQQIFNQQLSDQQQQQIQSGYPNWPQENNPQAYNNVYVQPYRPPMGGVINDQSKLNQNAATMNYQHLQSNPYYQNMQHPHNLNYKHQLQQYQQLYRDQNQYQNQVAQSNEQNVQSYPTSTESRPSAEPSSLLKMRLYKEVIRPQKRNNGLQDPGIVKKEMMEMQKCENQGKGLEYLASLGPKKQSVKLNGTQDRSEMDTELQHRLVMAACQLPSRRVSANGLENSRNRDNPVLPQRLSNMMKPQQEYLREYPRQKEYSRNCNSVPAERENGTVATDQQFVLAQQQHPNMSNTMPFNEKNPLMARTNLMPFRFDPSFPQHYQQMQQYYQNTKNLGRNNGEGDTCYGQRNDMQTRDNFNRAGGDTCNNMNGFINEQTPCQKFDESQGMNFNQPNIHEARTIGGVKYLARKQDYIPNMQVVPPEMLANKHLQSPVLY